jgi:peroxiredoxin
MDSARESVPPPISAVGGGLAITSLVLGILAICLSFLLVGGLLGLVGLIFGVVHLSRRRAFRGMGWWGVGLSSCGLLAAAGFGFLYFRFFQQTRSAWESRTPHTPLAAWEGVTAPDFTVTTIDGATMTLSEWRGKRVVVNFWATWCPPCRKEIPHLVKLINDTSRDDLVILGISSEEAAAVESFAKKNQLNYPLASAPQLPAPFDDVRSIPTTFFIDRRGVIQNVVVGYRDFETLKTHALQPDFEGTPKAAPAAAASGLNDSEPPRKPVTLWEATVAGACALGCGGLR